MNSGWKKVRESLLAPIVTCILLGVSYTSGYRHGKAGGEVLLRKNDAAHAQEQRLNADAHAEKLAETMAAYEAEVVLVNELAAQLAGEKKSHARETKRLAKKIARVAGNGDHVFSLDFICLLNAAAGVSNSKLPEDAAAALSAGKAGACTSFDTRLLADFEGVKEADLLAWFIEYAERCKRMESQLGGWSAFIGREEKR